MSDIIRIIKVGKATAEQIVDSLVREHGPAKAVRLSEEVLQDLYLSDDDHLVSKQEEITNECYRRVREDLAEQELKNKQLTKRMEPKSRAKRVVRNR